MIKQIRTLVVDDEPLARKGLLVRLDTHPEVIVVGEAAGGRQAFEQIQELKPDLVFLDIQMPGWNGFDVLRELQQADKHLPLVVFVTAYDNYAIKAFDVRAIDYLLKPVDEERLAKTIHKVLEHINNQQELGEQQQVLMQLVAEMSGEDCEEILKHLADNKDATHQKDKYADYIAIKDSGEITRVAVKDIEWIEAAGDYMCIYTSDETHILRRTMKELEQELNPSLFQRIHRSAIVNIHQVEKLINRQNGEYHLVLLNGKELKVSRSYKDKMKQFILGESDF